MILSKLGRRVGAVLAVLLLLLNLAVPLASASANSSNLPPVGWAETVSGFLMACGIYPFETDEDGNYTEWSVGSLVPLWNQFREDVSTVTSDIRDMAGYLVNGVIAIASGRWSVLREFASWIVNKFNVTDNQAGVELGTVTGSFPFIPALFQGNNSGEISRAELYESGLKVGTKSNGSFCSVSTNFQDVGCFYYDRSSTTGLYIVVAVMRALDVMPTTPIFLETNWNGGTSYTQYSYPLPRYTVDGVSCYASGEGSVGVAGSLNPSIPVYDNYWSGIRAFLGAEFSFSGITADTTTVSIPAELPTDTPYGGLTVAGAGAAVTVETLTEIVQEAVIEGLKPIVNTLLVNLSPDIEVNPDSGEITQGEITITPADIDLVSSDYQIRQLHTVFPFSIPWDVANVFSALNAEPVRPYWEVSLTLPGILGQPDMQIPFTIGISDDNPLSEAVDNFAALIRNFLLVLMCVGTLVLFFKR